MTKKSNVNIIKSECEKELSILKNKTVSFMKNYTYTFKFEVDEHTKTNKNLKQILTQKISTAISNGYTNFITGLNLGFDMLCAEIIIEIRKTNKDIKLIAALAYEKQFNLLDYNHKIQFFNILEDCDEIRCLYLNYNKVCYKERLNYMLNNSSLIIELFDLTIVNKFLENQIKNNQIKLDKVIIQKIRK